MAIRTIQSVLGSNAVGSAAITDLSVSTADIANGAVTAAKLGTVYAANITGLGSLATQESNNISITGGNVVGLSNLQVSGNITLANAFFETANVQASAVGANISIDPLNSGFIYYTSNATANTTVNITGVSSLGTGASTTLVLMQTNGAAAYKVNTVQVEGTTANVTTRWLGGTAPTSGNAANVDIYTFNVVKTNTSSYSVFASQSQFG